MPASDDDTVGDDLDETPGRTGGEDGFEHDSEYEDDRDEDGLAPEAGRRRPSVLSLLLLVAGAIWILVALLKLGDSPADDLPTAAIADHAETGSNPLPDVDEDQAEGADDGGLGQLFHDAERAVGEPGPDPQLPSVVTNSQENGAVVEDPDRSRAPEVGNPASERGPPEGSLLAGKVWPQDYVAPDVVHYTIKRGGSMKVVANLYKIFHHEIEALNPGVSLERELPPSTKIVVYRHKPGVASRSVGFPGDGSIEGAMPMVDGPGRILKHTPWKGWATTTTVATLDVILREWERRFPKRQPILVGNMSARSGGRLKPHSSHQSGRDVDLSYPQIWDRKEELNWRTMTASNLDRDLTWSLLELLRESGAVEVILIDTKIQKLLYEYALETRRYDEKQLENWMQYPGSARAEKPLIQHVPGHEDHIHVRFKCTAAETRCQSRED
ncbi:MAG TPA: penicillin-insensitive murein endopeptidase [Enhygromyxa sp.]|nr:penicillin-insensitive murein endopeptidase [Enhygromyxa sp.]